MKVYVNTSFEGHWPVGTAAVVIADNPDRAAELLLEHLANIGLPQRPGRGVPCPTGESMKDLVTSDEMVVILCDGNY